MRDEKDLTPNSDDFEDQKLTQDWDQMTADEEKRTASQPKTSEKKKKNLSGDEIKANPQLVGINAIVNNTSVNYERLPMLEVVFDRLVRLMSTSLRNFTSDNVEVSLEEISSKRFGDYLDAIPLPIMISVVKAEEWDNYALLMIDCNLIYSVVDVLLGGRRGTSAVPVEGRAFTTIERKLVERMSHVILSDLSAAFNPVSSIKFRFERLETNPRFAAIARAANAATLARLKIDMEGRGGFVELLIPNATFEPVRELLLQMFLGEKFGRDTIWENHLARELWQTDVELSAKLDSMNLPLSDVLRWRVGTELVLNATPDSPVHVTCDDVPIFEGRMGQKNGNVSVKVESILFK